MDELSSICAKRGFILNTIGMPSSYDVYSVVANPHGTKTIAYTAGVHGNEVAGPLAVLQFLSEVRIPKDIRLWAVPLVNPWGFIHGKRETEGRININRQFASDHPRREAGVLKRAAERQKVHFLHSIHEDNEATGFYLYYENERLRGECKEILEAAEEHMPLETRKNIHGSPVSEEGLILVTKELAKRPENAKSFEKWMYGMGTDYICTETPSHKPLKQRVDCICEVMKYVVTHF